MKQVSLGVTGEKVSEFCLGAMLMGTVQGYGIYGLFALDKGLLLFCFLSVTILLLICFCSALMPFHVAFI